MNEKEAYEKKTEAQLNEWSAEVDRLKAKAEKAAADAQIDFQREIDSAKAKMDAANDKLQEVKNASDDAWEDLKNGLDGALSSLGTALEAGKSRFS